MSASRQFNELSITLSTGSFDAYLNTVFKIPNLEVDEEHRLAKQYSEHGCIASAQTLVIHHLKFVAKIASSYSGYGLGLPDLVQEGNIGLMKAVKNFDVNRGVRLAVFAIFSIKAEIHDFVLRNCRIVRIATTKPQRKLFFNLRKEKKEQRWFSREEIELIAEKHEVPVKDVIEMEQRLMCGGQDSFHAENDDDFCPESYLASNDSVEDAICDHQQFERNTNSLLEGMRQLTDRQMDILQQRWLNDSSTPLRELSQKYNISIERVRQIEKDAIKKVGAIVCDKAA